MVKKLTFFHAMAVILSFGLMMAAYFAEQLNNERHLISVQQSVKDKLGLIRSRLDANLNSNIQLVKGLVSVVAFNPQLNQEEFERAAEPLFKGHSQLRNIAAAPDLVIRLMYPLAGNEKAIGLDYRKNPEQVEAAELARQTEQMILAGPLQLVQGDEGIIARIPVFTENSANKKLFWGLISTVINSKQLYQDTGLLDNNLKIEIAIRGKDSKGPHGDVFFGRPELFDESPVIMDILLPYGSWQIAAIPSMGWVSQPDNVWQLRLIFFVISIFILVPFLALGHSIKALRLARVQAEHANLTKSEFLSSMSHEIRTPMNAVLGMAQLLEDTSLNDVQKDYLRTIKQSGDGLLSIINDILDFSKLDAGKSSIEFISFNLERICQESMKLVEVTASAKKLEFIFDYDPDCPRYFMGDPSRIRQVLINLMGNAVKFTHEGFIRLKVSCQTSELDEQPLRIDVEDSGIGLKSKTIEHLFDKFTQADQTTTRKYGGTGLGLAISKKLVQLMGGEIGVDSVYGQGTTFWFTMQLPLAATPAPIQETSLDNIRILFVNDNNKTRDIFARMLQHMGARITYLNEPDHILEILLKAISQENDPYQIAIIDQILYDNKSLELGIAIRRDRKLDDLKLLIFSSAGEKGDSTTFYQAGFNAYLGKICRYEVLQTMLTLMLKHTLEQPIITQHSIEDSLSSNAAIDKKFNVSILVVEDVPTNQIIAKKFLTKIGAMVDIANNGQEAIEHYKNNRYDLIFMDCLMPVMDGYKATQVIRQLEKEKATQILIPIIALTANASTDERQLCQEAGMDAVVTKPFKLIDLTNCLQQWLPASVIMRE